MNNWDMSNWDFEQKIIEKSGIKKYGLASELGFSDVTLARWFRERPTFQRKKDVDNAIRVLLSRRETDLKEAIRLMAER